MRRSEDEARVGSQLERTPFSLQSLVHSSQAVAVYTAVDGRNGQRCIIKLKKISGNLTIEQKKGYKDELLKNYAPADATTYLRDPALKERRNPEISHLVPFYGGHVWQVGRVRVCAYMRACDL